MLAGGERISFYSVATRAQVARSTLYRRPDLRRLVEDARASERLSSPSAANPPSRIAELESELARVRQERDELKRTILATRPVSYFSTRLEAVA